MRRLALVAISAALSRGMSSGGALNVLGTHLAVCCPGTGFHRNGSCTTGVYDTGSHTVCAVVTRAFLDYTKTQGNDLETPNAAYSFAGLKPGDRWCLCAGRWAQAFKVGKAPPVVLAATNAAALRTVPLADLLAHAHEQLPKEQVAALLEANGSRSAVLQP
jgi:uncharacterized protein (DUF2237 family)